MKKIKNIILVVSILACVVVATIVLLRVDYGALAIRIIEHIAHAEITYGTMNGSIFRGYQIEDYCIRMSDTDSIYGTKAEIFYRFIPSLLRLPNLFEVTLIEPNVHFTRKRSETPKKGGGFSIPSFSAGLRLNIKNGTVIYQDEKYYTFDAISGLVFIDLVGSAVYMNTMNLSVRSTSLPVTITSMNIDMKLTGKEVNIKSLRVKGAGFTARGEGIYSFENRNGEFTVEKAHLDLGVLAIHKGSIDLSGQIRIAQGMIQPFLHGSAHGVDPLEQCDFETNLFGDTIFVNIVEGNLYGGKVFAQVKIHENALYEIDANFRELDLAPIIDIDHPLLLSGYMAYRDHGFQGFVSSPRDSGVAVESLYVCGHLRGDSIYIDSLILQETERLLFASGRLAPACDIVLELNELAIDRFAQFTSLPDTLFQGIVSGTCHLLCSSRRIEDLTISAALSGRALRFDQVSIKEARVTSDEFRIRDQSNTIECHLLMPAYGSTMVDSLYVTVTDHAYFVNAKKGTDFIKAQGELRENLTGTIASLSIRYHGIETHNNAPTDFDIPGRSISDFDFSFAGGTLRGSLVPLALELNDADLDKISTLLNLPDPIHGSLECRIRRNRIFVTARNVQFLGLDSGEVHIKGEIDDNTVLIEELAIFDSLQHLNGYATLAPESSDIHTSFTNVGIWVLPFLEEIMIDPQGRISGELGLSGTAEDFSFRGTVMIENGSFDIEPIAASFDSVQAEVQFDGKRILFKNGGGTMSRMGRFAPSSEQRSIVHTGGLIILGPRFKFKSMHFDYSFQDAPLQLMPFAYGVGSGNISMGVRNDTTYYNGAITLKQAIVPLEFGQQFEEDTTSEDEEWTMNIKIKGERNIWLRNRDADIELGGELFLIKERGPLYLTGVLTTHRGNYYWLNHTLSISEGKLTFLPQEPVQAELDIWAEMNTRDRDPTTGTPIIIRLHMFGTITEPIFEFFSDPPYYTEQDIVTYLNLNITWSELESMKRGEFVRTVLPRSIVSWLESDVSRRIRQYTGLDYFRIETPFFEEESSTRLTVGKYISRKLFISYTYDITSFENEFNVEYFIDDKNEILVRRDEEGEYSVQYQYRIRF
ncbi:translocation/assembly module TamB domain-containing protein [candidate division WOR-3 bacterium]|nr:translocation/assembly module TamB domain-containing protein [candidate division WOR-3 bacterium]